MSLVTAILVGLLALAQCAGGISLIILWNAFIHHKRDHSR